MTTQPAPWFPAFFLQKRRESIFAAYVANLFRTLKVPNGIPVLRLEVPNGIPVLRLEVHNGIPMLRLEVPNGIPVLHLSCEVE